jgi:WD40 repeat protein
VSGGHGGDLKIWDAARTPDPVILPGHAAYVTDVGFSPDGQRLLSASADGSITLWQIASGDAIWRNNASANPVLRVASSPDGLWLATGSKGGGIAIWDAKTGKQALSFVGNSSDVQALDFSPDSRHLVSGGSDRRARIWDRTSGRQRAVTNELASAVVTAAFEPDGALVRLMLANQTLQEWDPVQNQLISEEANDGMVCMACPRASADGQRIVSSGCGQQLTVRDAETGRLLITLPARGGCKCRVALNRDGSRLAAAYDDPVVHVWDVATGQEMLALDPADNRVSRPADKYLSLAMTADGLCIAAGRGDGSIVVWDGRVPSPDQLVRRQAQSAVDFLIGRGLSQSEIGDRLRGDVTIDENVRCDALRLIHPSLQAAIALHARRMVQSMYAKPLFREEVIERIGRDHQLSAEVRRQALALAQVYPEYVDGLWLSAWLVARQPGAAHKEYELALRQAQAACRLAPEDVTCLEGLAMVQYRLEQYENALHTLDHCIRASDQPPFERVPWHEGLRAMAYHQLGQRQEARAAFDRMREFMTQPRWANHPEARTFWQEAQKVLKPSLQGS